MHIQAHDVLRGVLMRVLVGAAIAGAVETLPSDSPTGAESARGICAAERYGTKGETS